VLQVYGVNRMYYVCFEREVTCTMRTKAQRNSKGYTAPQNSTNATVYYCAESINTRSVHCAATLVSLYVATISVIKPCSTQTIYHESLQPPKTSSGIVVQVARRGKAPSAVKCIAVPALQEYIRYTCQGKQPLRISIDTMSPAV
jgi:hypothetical protein